MTVRLTVDRAAWMAHLRSTAAAYGDGMVPVVKGNGYGFGRPVLHQLVPRLHAGADGHMVCVGTVHELHDVPPGLTPVVLTPTLGPPPDEGAATEPPILTVGSLEHVQALAGWRGRVIVKLASSMRRYGATPHELPALLAATAAAGLQVHAFGLHLPLAGDDHARLVWAFREATSRTPTADEGAILMRALARERATFAARPAAAQALLAIGEAPRDERLTAGEHAAWAQIAALLQNLSETITRN